VGGKLLEVLGYAFGVLVTRAELAAGEVWRTDNGRAWVEPRIEKLKNDLATADFCPQQFFATEAAFNLLSLFPRASGRGEDRQPATKTVP
jgi:hypothetical protein